MKRVFALDKEAVRAKGHNGNVFLVDRSLEEIFDLLLDKVSEDHINDIFEIHPYCWCNRADCPQCGQLTQPNFIYKKSGLIIAWYKYPFRGAYSNKKISKKEFKKLVQECIDSL